MTKVITKVSQLKVGMKLGYKYKPRWLAEVTEIRKKNKLCPAVFKLLRTSGDTVGTEYGEEQVGKTWIIDIEWIKEGCYYISEGGKFLSRLKRVKKTSIKPVYAYMEEMK